MGDAATTLDIVELLINLFLPLASLLESHALLLIEAFDKSECNIVVISFLLLLILIDFLQLLVL